MLNSVRSHGLLLLTTSLLLAPSASAVSIDWITVGSPGNAADTTGFGSVAGTYMIGKYEVTNAQYTEFLNAKAASDPLGLYNTFMAGTYGGITQSGSPGSHTYNTVAGRENNPVIYVSFYDTLRFSNWLNNGQGSGDTETGAYTLLGGSAAPSNGLTITRNPSANVFLTNEDEWYKAAYYDAIASSYNPDPFADGINGVCQTPAGTTNHSANCFFAVVNTTAAGAYASSPSATGTFDQGGNVREWNESIIGSNRGVRGGDWRGSPSDLAASNASSMSPTVEGDFAGFRVASVPEPGTGLLVMAGLLNLGAWRRRRP